MAAAFFSACNAKQNKEMEELRQLTAGQRAVVDAYLENYLPAETYNPDEHLLLDTQTMMLEMNTMCLFDENMLCDYLVEKGYRAHYELDASLNGWIVKEVEED